MKNDNLSNLEMNAVYHCRDLELIARLPDASVNLLCVDPPYGISNNVPMIIDPDSGGRYNRVNEDWDRFVPLEWMTAIRPKLAPGGSVVAFGSWDSMGIIHAEAQRLGWCALNRVVWHKTDPAPNFSGRMMTYSTEEFFWYCPDGTGWTYNTDEAKAMNGGKNLHDVWDIGQTREQRFHPTQKPLPLMDRVIRLFSREGDLVVDCFCGSGSTLVSARNWKRRYVGCDQSAEYVAVAQDRLRLPFEAKQRSAVTDLTGLPMFAGGTHE